MAPKTSIRGLGPYDATNTVMPSPRRCPSGPYWSVSLRPDSSSPRASADTASSARSDPNVPRTSRGRPSGRMISRRPTRPGSTCETIVATATCSPASTAAATSPSSGKVSRSTASTKTSTTPPHVSPTANASASLTPNRCSAGRPSDRTLAASSYTAPSTQPPETEPTASPPGPTSIDAPGGRGADWNVATTVPTPTVCPASHHGSNSAITSRTRDHLQRLCERRHAVSGDEVVDEGHRRDDSALHRQVAGFALMRVDPHDSMRQSMQSAHSLAQLLTVAALPPVAHDDDDGATG